jgi:hypothetical protein
MNTTEYLFDGPHWEIDPIGPFDIFFKALPALVPPGAILCLSEGVWDDELLNFLQRHRVPAPEGLICPSQFLDGAHIPATPEVLNELVQIADHHADPEIAIYAAVSYHAEQILEWCDATCDPFAVALSIPEERVRAFCALAGVQYRKKL